MGLLGGASTKETVIDAMNTIVAQSFLSSTTNCQENIGVGQTINITCNSDVVYEDQKACLTCQDNVLAKQQARFNIIKASWNPSAGYAPVPYDINQEIKLLTEDFQGCLTNCKNCIIQDLAQTNNFKWTTDCKASTTSVNDWKTKIQENLSQALTDNQSAMSSMAQVFGAQTKQQLVAQLTANFEEKINIDVMQTLIDNIQSQQYIQISAGGKTNVKAQTQNAAIAGTSQLIADLNITNTVMNDEQFQAYQYLYNQQNIIDDLGNIAQKAFVGVGDVVNNLLGQIMIAAIALLILVLCILFGIAFYKWYKEKYGTK